MELIRYYYERLKPYLKRRYIEMAAVVVMLLCALGVLISSLPIRVKTDYPDKSMTYEGQVVRQRMSGKGKLTFANGDVYEGSFSNGIFQGRGKFTAKSGWVYEGEFLNGLAHGKGMLTTENGVVYSGEFEKGTYRDEH